MTAQIAANLELFKVDFDEDDYCSPTCCQCTDGCCTAFSPTLKEDRTPRADGCRKRLYACVEANKLFKHLHAQDIV